MYTPPAVLSVLRRFSYLCVLSNAQDSNFFKCSLLPNVQGEVHLSLPCPQPAVLRPCTRPSAIMFTTSWLKMTSESLASGVHPKLRNFSSLVNVYVKHFLFMLRAREGFLERAFQNAFNNVYAILMHCYLFHRLTTPSPILLHITMQKSFLLSHDFIAWMRKSSSEVFFSPMTCLQTVAFNCFCSSRQRRRCCPCAATRRYRVRCQKPCFKRFLSRPCLDLPKNAKSAVVCSVGLGHVGGGSRRGIKMIQQLWSTLDP